MPPASTIKRVTAGGENRSGPPVFGMTDRQRDALYDRVRVFPGMSPNLMVAFQYPVGVPDPFTREPRTYADTNMLAWSMFTPPHSMIFRRVLFLFHPAALPEDRNAILDSYYWQLNVLEKTKQRQPLLTCAAFGQPEHVIENFGKGSWLNDEGPRENDSSIPAIAQGKGWNLALDEQLEIFVPPLVNFNVTIIGKPVRVREKCEFYVLLDGSRDSAVM